MAPYDIGVQSFTYREFDVPEICGELDGTPVDAVELCDVHVAPDDDPARIADVRDQFADVGVDVCGFGVHYFDGPGGVDDVLSLVEDLDAAYVSADVDPGDDATIDALAREADDRGLLVGVHNHGPGHRYASVDDVLAVCEGRPAAFGACVDTGHFLRVGETPADVVPALGDRVHAVHVKDFVDADTETVPGEGDLDVTELVDLLAEHTDFDQPLVVEYEEDPDDPTPAVLAAARRLGDAT